MTDVFLHTHSGRNRRTLLVLALVYGAILTAVLMIDLSPWIAGVMVLFTLPALWEVATNPQSRLEMDQGTLAFSGPNGSQSLMLNTIDHVLRRKKPERIGTACCICTICGKHLPVVFRSMFQ